MRQPLNDSNRSSAANSGNIALVSRWTKCPIPVSGGRRDLVSIAMRICSIVSTRLYRFSRPLAVEHRRNRKQSTRLRRILHPLRNSPNVAARIVRPHHNGSPHGKRPSVCHLESFYRRFGNPKRVRFPEDWYYISHLFGWCKSSASRNLPLSDDLLFWLTFPRRTLAVCGKTWKLKFFSLLRVIGFGVFDHSRRFLVV